MNILQINGSRAKLCDERGDSNGIQLCFTLGEKLDLQFDLRGAPGSDGILLPYIPEWADECRSFYFAMDNSWKNQTSPLFLRTSDISLAGSVLSVKIPAATSDGLLTALAGRASAVFDVEIGGFSETLQSLFVWQFKVSVCNRIYAGAMLRNPAVNRHG